MKSHGKAQVITAILSYSLCSGLLALINKLTLHQLPYPSLVVCVQLVGALVFIAVAKYAHLLKVDPITWENVVPYLYFTVIFAFSRYTNMRALATSNVETVIVFRALGPCVVAFMDYAFLHHELPSGKSWAGLLLIVAGSMGYASFDDAYHTLGWMAYGWPFAYLLSVSVEIAYGKTILRKAQLQTFTGPVLYTNLFGLPAMLVFAGMGNEFANLQQHMSTSNTSIFTPSAIFFLLFGCAAGTGIGYSSWYCRDAVSATSYTVIGVLNKCLTILLNLLVWDQHARLGGIASLSLCLVGGTLYRQAPLRAEALAALKNVDDTEEEGSKSDGTEASYDTEEGGGPEGTEMAQPLVEKTAVRRFV